MRKTDVYAKLYVGNNKERERERQTETDRQTERQGERFAANRLADSSGIN